MKDTEIKESDLQDVFEFILGSLSNEDAKYGKMLHKNKEASRLVSAIEKMNIDGFDNHFNIPMNKVVFGMVTAGTKKYGLTAAKNSEVAFILTGYRFLLNQFGSIIERFEGMSCRTDKARTLVKIILKHVVTGDPLDLSGGSIRPEVIFQDAESVTAFYRAVQCLYYGNPEPYLSVLSAMMAVSR